MVVVGCSRPGARLSAFTEIFKSSREGFFNKVIPLVSGVIGGALRSLQRLNTNASSVQYATPMSSIASIASFFAAPPTEAVLKTANPGEAPGAGVPKHGFPIRNDRCRDQGFIYSPCGFNPVPNQHNIPARGIGNGDTIKC